MYTQLTAGNLYRVSEYYLSFILKKGFDSVIPVLFKKQHIYRQLYDALA